MIKNKKGFTLIELIIVMAIIGILAVVAIVAISGKSADARDARRMADMSAVQTGFALYCYEAGELGNATTVTCPGGAAGATVKLNTCTDGDLGDGDGDITPTIALAGIKDPASEAGTAVCTSGSTALCEYGITLGGVATLFDSCDYTVYARLETTGTNPDLMTVTEAGITRS